jgi:general stress protein 26
MTLRQMQLGWKYRRPLWKYRKLIAHRREIAGVALGGAALVAAVMMKRGSAKPATTQVLDTKARVYDLIRGFSTTMLVTKGSGDRAESRPMHMAKVDDGGTVYFFAGRSGRVVEEIATEPAVLLVFQGERSAYLSLRGRARVIADKTKVKKLWNESYKVWFPGGIEDPELTLLAVDPASAEYWDNRGMNKLEYLFEAGKAYLQGTRPDVGDADHHAKVSL